MSCVGLAGAPRPPPALLQLMPLAWRVPLTLKAAGSAGWPCATSAQKDQQELAPSATSSRRGATNRSAARNAFSSDCASSGCRAGTAKQCWSMPIQAFLGGREGLADLGLLVGTCRMVGWPNFVLEAPLARPASVTCGSSAAAGLALGPPGPAGPVDLRRKRKPSSRERTPRSRLARHAERAQLARLCHDPPRSTRVTPPPVGSDSALSKYRLGASAHHSHRLPCISCKPQGLAGRLRTATVCSRWSPRPAPAYGPMS